MLRILPRWESAWRWPRSSLGCQNIRDDVWLVRPGEPRAYLETVCVGAHLERLAGDERERFLDAVMVRLGERPLLDYVRVNIVARRR